MNCGICCATGLLIGSYWPIVVLPAVLVPLNHKVTLEESGILPSLCIAAAVRCFGVILRTAIEMGAVFLATAFLMQTFSGTEAVPTKPARKKPRARKCTEENGSVVKKMC